MKVKNGTFIMIDGVAGSGKTTILEAAAASLASAGKRTFHLKEWEEIHKAPPRFEDVAEHDVFFTYEPTRSWIGAALRYELFRTDKPYGGEELAHAFALDRMILYRRLIIPALEAGKMIIQDRGVSSSIAYQPIMPGGKPPEETLRLPGNVLAMDYAPDHLILTRLAIETVIERLGKRKDEGRGAVGEIDLLRKVQERLHSPWFRAIFEEHGTTVHAIDTDLPREQMVENATRLFSTILTP